MFDRGGHTPTNPWKFIEQQVGRIVDALKSLERTIVSTTDPIIAAAQQIGTALTAAGGFIADLNTQAGNVSNAVTQIAALLAAGDNPAAIAAVNALVPQAQALQAGLASADAAIDTAAAGVEALVPAPSSSSSAAKPA